MKNRFCVLIISLLPLFAKAQEEAKTTQLGFTVSPNLGWLSTPGSNSNEGDRSPRVGISYGVIADLGFARNYFFGTGFTLTRINSRDDISAENVTNKRINSLQYIEVPLTLKLKSNEGQMARFYGQFGLGTGIKVRATQDYEYRDTDGNTASGNNVNISDDTNIFRLSLIAGAGAEWNIGRNLNIQTGVTFNNGFTNAFTNDDSKNSYVALNLGVFF
ncbi:porin family protein [Pedobacter sp. SYSU D00535]|uniref:porin family protein n=1 Tax=Pedobacter sp. SYSU D00535 TaxID=2810308 RepID=UPI001A96E61A|nr:porin family protein [Pedobacter sp. SYSU D00535]